MCSTVYEGRRCVFRRRRPLRGFSYYYTMPPARPPMMVLRPRQTQSVAADSSARANKRARVADATEAAIRGLPEVSPGRGAKLLQAECAVCLKDFQAEDTLRTMPCAHAFHQECIFPWLRRKAACPLCRQQLPKPQELLCQSTCRRHRIPRSVSLVL